MTTNSDRASARIYTFPARGRFAAGQRDETKPVVNFTSHPVKAVVGEAWYHDEAIKEAATDDGRHTKQVDKDERCFKDLHVASSSLRAAGAALYKVADAPVPPPRRRAV